MSQRTRSYGTFVGSEVISEVTFKDSLSFNLNYVFVREHLVSLVPRQ